jgi:hypothetical protein
VKVSLNMQVVVATGVGHVPPAMVCAAAAGINQSPWSCAGTGPPAGVPEGADGVVRLAVVVDCPHATTSRTNETKAAREHLIVNPVD